MANQNAQHSCDAMRCQAEQQVPAPPGLTVHSALEKRYGLIVPAVTGGEIHKQGQALLTAESGESEMKETKGNGNGGGKGRG